MTPAPSLGELFWGFTRVGLSGFGGVLPFVRRMLVEERRWISAADFNTLIGLCQFLPGPNVINLAVCVGARFHGVRGALVAPAGLLGAPVLIILALGFAYGAWGHLPMVQDMLRGIAAVGAGLLFATAVKMSREIREKRIYLPFAALILFAVAVLRWPLPPLMLALLACTAGIAWRRGRSGAAGTGENVR